MSSRHSRIDRFQNHHQLLLDLNEEAEQAESELLAMIFDDSDEDILLHERQPIGNRNPNKERDSEAGHHQLMKDYLDNDAIYNEADFERRFRVTK